MQKFPLVSLSPSSPSTGRRKGCSGLILIVSNEDCMISTLFKWAIVYVCMYFFSKMPPNFSFLFLNWHTAVFWPEKSDLDRSRVRENSLKTLILEKHFSCKWRHIHPSSYCTLKSKLHHFPPMRELFFLYVTHAKLYKIWIEEIEEVVRRDKKYHIDLQGKMMDNKTCS